MRWRMVMVAGLALAGAGLTTGAAAQQAFPEGDAQRGAYLARMSGCIACHTDTKGGGKPLAGGAPIETPFGAFLPPNITPHPRDGIGGWTVADFGRALRQGESPTGEPYYPSFPYRFYTGFSDQDVADLWAAFQTVPAADGGRPGHDLGFPWSVREGLAVWRGLYFEPGRWQPDPARSEQWNRGAYITEVAAHCGACHTPRTLLGGPDEDATLAGGVIGEDRKVPAITAEALREKGWTEDDLVIALRSGLTPDGDAFGGGMAEVVREGTKWLREDDLRAVAAYLLSDKD